MAARRRRSTEVELVEEKPGVRMRVSDLRPAPALPRATGKPANPLRRVRWALRFLQENLEDPRKRDKDYEPIRADAIRLFALALAPALLTTADLREAQRRLQVCLESLKKGEPWPLDAGSMRLIVSLPRGRAEGGGVQIDQAPQGRWQRIVLGVLDAMRRVGPRLRLCGEPGCQKIFLVNHVRKFLCPTHAVARQAQREANWHRAQRKRDLAHEAYKRTHPGAERRPKIVPPASAAR